MTHSTGFVLPSYMVKVGLVNLWGRLVFSISKKKKGDWDICCKFLLIASHTEVDSVTGIWELETIMCWETGLLCLSLSCSSLLFFLGGEETILSLRRLFFPCEESALAPHGDGSFSFLSSWSYLPALAHLLRNDQVLDFDLFNDEVLHPYGEVTPCPHPPPSTTLPLAPLAFPISSLCKDVKDRPC